MVGRAPETGATHLKKASEILRAMPPERYTVGHLCTDWGHPDDHRTRFCPIGWLAHEAGFDFAQAIHTHHAPGSMLKAHVHERYGMTWEHTLCISVYSDLSGLDSAITYLEREGQ